MTTDDDFLTINDEYPVTGAWRELLGHPDIDRLFDAYLGENADLLVAGRPAPPLQDYLIGSGMTHVPALRVTYAGKQTGGSAVADAQGHNACRLVCRTVQGSTDCYWICPS